MRLTYAGFLALFVALPLLAVAVKERRALDRRALLAIAPLLLIVYAAALAWDGAAIAAGMWRFDESRLCGVRVGRIPLEETFFFGLQALLTAIPAWARLRRLGAGA